MHGVRHSAESRAFPEGGEDERAFEKLRVLRIGDSAGATMGTRKDA